MEWLAVLPSSERVAIELELPPNFLLDYRILTKLTNKNATQQAPVATLRQAHVSETFWQASLRPCHTYPSVDVQDHAMF